MAEENRDFVVVEDPTGDYWEGAIVEANRAHQLRSRGCAVLPVLTDLFRVSGVGGFHKRAWGAGWSLDRAIPRIAASLTMYCSKDFAAAHWAVKLIPDTSFLEKLESETDREQLNGFLRFTSDPGQAIPFKCGVTAKEMINARDLKKQDLRDGAWILTGSAQIHVPGDAHYGFGFYGMAPGLRIAWAAVSQARV